MGTPDDRFESRLRELLEPDRAAIERVQGRAFSAPPPRPVRVRWLTASAVVGLLAAVGGFLYWHPTSPPTLHVAATYEDDAVIIQAPDGSALIFGPPAANQAPPGTWQIIIEGDRK